MVTTDEIRTYALFNYEYMRWTSHTEAGGSTDDGQGGVPAYVSLSSGFLPLRNGKRAFGRAFEAEIQVAGTGSEKALVERLFSSL